MSIWSTLPLDQLTVPILQDELRAQGQRTGGRKSELISRLQSLDTYPITEPLLRLLPVGASPTLEVKTPSTIQITLDNNTVLTVSRDILIQILPDSVISRAITSDSSIDSINIPQPGLTSIILKALLGGKIS